MVHAPDEYGESGRAESLVVRLKNELHAATPAPFGASMPIGVKRKAPAFGHPPLNDNGWAACYLPLSVKCLQNATAPASGIVNSV